jgi:hypothetical protein
VDKLGAGANVAVLGKMDGEHNDYQISRIITSPMRDNSDIIYLYNYIDKGENNGTEIGPNEAFEPTAEGSEGTQE